MSDKVNKKEEFTKVVIKQFGAGKTMSRSDLTTLAAKQGVSRSVYRWMLQPEYKVDRGLYRVPAEAGTPTKVARKIVTVQPQHDEIEAPAIAAMTAGPRFDINAETEYSHAEVPARDKLYVPFGEFNDILQVVKSGDFFPVFISGYSGNGKTVMVEQACAKAGRRMVRVQMSRETDEDDMIGGLRLINGETKFIKGPVLRAMEIGALLLVDEADRADPGKIMCLQGVLEGKPYYVKKTGEIVTPKHGFNVIVTANTKGKGSDDGRYVAASVLDDAWLERFPIAVEQEHPSASVETKILMGNIKEKREPTEKDINFIKYLVQWAESIRVSFKQDACDEVITTRRLVHIIKTYLMFKDNRERAIQLCINRFDAEVAGSFMELYRKIDADNAPQVQPVNPVESPTWSGSE
jgi:MoxR-like ATPase